MSFLSCLETTSQNSGCQLGWIPQEEQRQAIICLCCQGLCEFLGFLASCLLPQLPTEPYLSSCDPCFSDNLLPSSLLAGHLPSDLGQCYFGSLYCIGKILVAHKVTLRTSEWEYLLERPFDPSCYPRGQFNPAAPGNPFESWVL